MTLPTALLTIRWMAADTFRQALASWLFWGMLALSATAILLCLSLTVHHIPEPFVPDENQLYLPPQHGRGWNPQDLRDEGVQLTDARVSLLFGLYPLADASGRGLALRDRIQLVRNIQMILASLIADKLGVMLALLFTAGFLPTFLEASAVTVLLAKPVPRWSLLAGKYLGVLAFVLFQAAVFVFGTWAALGARTGVWDGLYLLSLPLLMTHFAIFYSFSVLLAVLTRSTVVCAFGSIGFWLACWAMNFGHHAHVAMHADGPPPTRAELTAAASAVAGTAPGGGIAGTLAWSPLAAAAERSAPTSQGANFAFEVGYWLVPKPADIGILLYDSLMADNYFSQLMEYRTLKRHGLFYPELSILASLLFTLAILALAGYEFVTMDY